MGEPALFPLQGLTELDRTEPAVGRLAQLHEYLVLGQREPGIGLQLPVQAGAQQRSRAQVRTPGPLLVCGEPLTDHGPTLPGMNDVSCMLVDMTRHLLTRRRLTRFQ